MEMINKQALADFRAADMPDQQAETVASHIPDWSQFATKYDLEEGLKDLRHDLEKGMSRLESRLVNWMVGIFLAFLGILGGLITLILNIYNVFS